jgi:hypothetical protein
MTTMDESTPDEARKEELAEQAADRIKKGQHWVDWMLLGDGLMVGRNKAMFAAGTNQPKGKGYAKHFSAWLKARPWADLDNPTRRDLFWCVEHRSEIEVWRETLAQNERIRLNHPSAMKRRYEAKHQVPVERDAGDGAHAPKEGRYQKLEREYEALATEHSALKERLDRSGGGSLFDLHRDTAADIADTILRHVKLARTRGIRDALTKVIKREEDSFRKQSKQAG